MELLETSKETSTLNFRSNGKLLLTGEYLVLKGAKALAIPTSFGQDLIVKEHAKASITWSTRINKTSLFKGEFDLKGGVKTTDNAEFSDRLSSIFKAIIKLKKIKALPSVDFESALDFPTDWGLGSSSTLINNLAEWAEIDAFQLLKKTFGGSGYDVACAQSASPIVFYLDKEPKWNLRNFKPKFHEEIHFVHLNEKQDSRAAIEYFKSLKPKGLKKHIESINDITSKMVYCKTIDAFEALMDEHERIMAEILQLPTVKEKLFADYPGSIKSLGAWGGDFVMVTGDEADMIYFKDKGYNTILPFTEMIFKRISDSDERSA